MCVVFFLNFIIQLMVGVKRKGNGRKGGSGEMKSIEPPPLKEREEKKSTGSFGQNKGK